MEALTAKELFMFACKIWIGIDGNQMNDLVEEIIQRFSLQACQNTRIGGWFHRGVSGGERKRISIAYEVITNPSLLFLDEPTSGLDSSTALRIIKLLKKEAGRGMSILATIHQPSAELLFLFDWVICLSEGYTIYNGHPKEV